MMAKGQTTMLANSNELQILDTIKGNSFLAIQSVSDVIKRHNLDIAQSIISVLQIEGSQVIILARRSGAVNIDQGVGVRLETKAELTAQDLRSLRSGVQPLERLDEIHGISFLAIQAAMDAFRRAT
jgi:hypothetical protein